MAKKLGKFLVCSALIGSAVAGGIALYNKFKSSNDDFDDDSFDFDDFDDDFEEYAEAADSKEDSGRGYVSIPRENEVPAEEDYKVNVEVTINTDEDFTEEETATEVAEENADETPAENNDAKEEQPAKNSKSNNKK